MIITVGVGIDTSINLQNFDFGKRISAIDNYREIDKKINLRG